MMLARQKAANSGGQRDLFSRPPKQITPTLWITPALKLDYAAAQRDCWLHNSISFSRTSRL